MALRNFDGWAVLAVFLFATAFTIFFLRFFKIWRRRAPRQTVSPANMQNNQAESPSRNSAQEVPLPNFRQMQPETVRSGGNFFSDALHFAHIQSPRPRPDSRHSAHDSNGVYHVDTTAHPTIVPPAPVHRPVNGVVQARRRVQESQSPNRNRENTAVGRGVNSSHQPFNPDDLLSFVIKKEDKNGTCPICLGDLEEEPVSTGQCLHIVHTSCLKAWLAKDVKTACPVCRVSYNDTFLSDQSPGSVSTGSRRP